MWLQKTTPEVPLKGRLRVVPPLFLVCSATKGEGKNQLISGDYGLTRPGCDPWQPAEISVDEG